MGELVRFSVAMPDDLLEALDDYAARRGIAANRSEAIRDLTRAALVKEQVEDPESRIFGTVTMVFNHHSSDLRDKLDEIQHRHVDEIVSTVHVHLDEESCLEVVLIKGKSSVVREIADTLLGTKGVLHGELVVTTIGAPHRHRHDHDHGHGHDHDHDHDHEHRHEHRHD